MKDVEVEVTADDIAKGEPNMCGSCPVALAIRRRFPNNAGVIVTTFRVEVFLGRGSNFYTPPPETSAFILAFDAERPVEPLKFTMRQVA